jgi:hypothetical protein
MGLNYTSLLQAMRPQNLWKIYLFSLSSLGRNL